MFKTWSGVVLLSACSLLAACLINQGEVSPTKTVHFVGVLNEGTVDDILLAIDSNPAATALIINSSGGDEVAATRLAEKIQSSGIELIVDGACVSACAHLLLTAAERVTVRTGSVIAFHSNIFGSLPILKRDFPDDYPRYLAKAKQQYDYVNGQSVDGKILYCAHMFLEPDTQLFLRNEMLATKLKYRLLIVDKFALEALEIRLSPQSVYDGNFDVEKISRSGTVLTDARFEWQPQDCEQVDYTGWDEVVDDLSIN